MVAHLDHLVVVTPDLVATSVEIAAALGVAPTAGGRHVGRGTANRLLALGGGSYLEVIGTDPEQSDPSQPRPFGLDDVRERRLATYAARVESMPAAIDAARRSGYDPGEAMAMSRATTTGELLSWSLTTPPAWADGVVPFLIDWGDTVHPSSTAAQGATLRSLQVSHPDPARIRAVLAALDLAIEVVDGARPGLQAIIDGPSGTLTLAG